MYDCIRFTVLILVCALGTNGFPEIYSTMEDDEQSLYNQDAYPVDNDTSGAKNKRIAELSLNHDLKSLAQMLVTHRQRRYESGIKSRLMAIGKRSDMHSPDWGNQQEETGSYPSKHRNLVHMAKTLDIMPDDLSERLIDIGLSEDYSDMPSEETLEKPLRYGMVDDLPIREFSIVNRVPHPRLPHTPLNSRINQRQKRPAEQWRWRRGQRMSISGALSAIADMLRSESQRSEIASNRAHLIGIGKRSVMHGAKEVRVPMEESDMEDIY